jgi:DNA-binding protein H-NS
MNRPVRQEMNKSDLKSMPVDELWMFHDRIAAALIAKMSAAKTVLENRLSKLDQNAHSKNVHSKNVHSKNVHSKNVHSKNVHTKIVIPARRPYPKVRPKFQNPDDPSETWAGRGKQPRWLRKQLRSGKQLEDLRIASVAV